MSFYYLKINFIYKKILIHFFKMFSSQGGIKKPKESFPVDAAYF